MLIIDSVLTTPASAMSTPLIQFLREKLALSDAAIAIAQRAQQKTSGHLPIILWQYGLITLDQLDQIFDWLETI
jgi:hypothetical protein